MTRNRRTFDYWATCRNCSDQFTLIIEVTPDPRNEGGFIGRVERSRDLLQENNMVVLKDGRPLHRCGGDLRVIGDSYRVRIVE